MDNLVVNAVAPWEGYFHWLGNIREGRGKTGNAYAFADFTLRYSDHKMQEQFITFSISTPDGLEFLRGLNVGEPIRVMWFPSTNEDTQRNRWYPVNKAYNVSRIDKPGEKPAAPKQEKITAPSYPQPQPPLPRDTTHYSPSEDETDLPF